jgi:uncharacterized protein (TIGR01777 family)
MRILMTGGTGLVGRSLGSRLVKEGHDLNILSRNANAELPFPGRVFPWDGEKAPPPRDAIEGIEAVIHLAGENVAAGRWTASRKKQLRDSRILSTRYLAEGIQAQGIQLKTYIGASGIGYYGDQGERELTEDLPSGADFLARLCEDWEASHALVPAQRHVFLRLGVVLTAEGGFLGRIVPLFRTLGASRLSTGSQWLSWIHIADLLEICSFVLEKDIAGPLNASAPEPIRNRDMTEEVAKKLQVFRTPAVPEFALRLLYGELSQALLGSQKAIPERLLSSGFQFRFKDFRAALDSLELDQTSLIGRLVKPFGGH